MSETSGAGLDGRGQAQAGMGVDAEDIDGDGLPELFVTNFQNEYNTLYANLGQGTFLDATAYLGLAADSLPWVGWGCALGDFDGDGWPDCFVANGHVDDNRRALGQPIDYAEPPLLHRNVPLDHRPARLRRPWRRQADGSRLATRDAGPYFASAHVGAGRRVRRPRRRRRPRHRRQPQGRGAGGPPQRHAGGEPLDPPASSSAPAATATPSAPAWRWRSPAGRSTASARGAAASSRRTTRGS